MFIINFLEEEEERLTATSNSVWSLKADEQIMSWSTQQPHDWQIGGKCHAFLWGSGRHGQLGEAGEMIKNRIMSVAVMNKKYGLGFHGWRPRTCAMILKHGVFTARSSSRFCILTHVSNKTFHLSSRACLQ
jgi:hypothetical protein